MPSKFVSVLKKVGQVIVAGAAMGAEVMQMPFVAQLLGGLAGGKVVSVVQTTIGDLNSFAAILGTMEVAFPATGSGSQRLTAAAPIVQQGILLWAQSNLPGHNRLKATPEDFAAHCKAFTSDFADILNDFGD